MATAWAPPRSNPTPRPSAAPPADLDSAAGELALLRALVAYRPVGPHKHVQMAALLNRLAKDPGMRTLSNRDVWDKWNRLYDADTLEQVWRDQQEQLLPGSPSPSPTPTSTPSRAGSPAAGTADRSDSRRSITADGSEPPAGSSRLPRPSRLDAHYFPVREFSLTRHSTAAAATTDVGQGHLAAETDDQLSLAQLAFQRGQVPPGGRAESPAEGPLRQISVPPGHVLRGSTSAGTEQEEEAGEDGDDTEGHSVAADEEATERLTSTRKGKRGRPSSAAGSSTPAAAVPAPSPKKKRRTAAAVENASPSPRKRARTATKGGDAAAEESELSELSDDDDDDEEEEEEEGGEGGEGEEGGEAEEGDEEDSDGDTVADDDDDDFAPQSKSKATKKKKGAAASNRRPAATAASETAASRSASPGAAAAGATPAKTTRAGAAARAKKVEREKSESAATPRSSSRRSGANGPANKRR